MTFISLLATKSRGVHNWPTLYYFTGLAKNLDKAKCVSYMRVQSPFAKSKLFRLAFFSSFIDILKGRDNKEVIRLCYTSLMSFQIS